MVFPFIAHYINGVMGRGYYDMRTRSAFWTTGFMLFSRFYSLRDTKNKCFQKQANVFKCGNSRLVFVFFPGL